MRGHSWVRTERELFALAASGALAQPAPYTTCSVRVWAPGA